MGIASAICLLLLGNLSDFIGRIPILQGSLVINTCAILGFALARGKLVLIMLVLLMQLDGSTLVTIALMTEWLPIYWRGFLVVSMNAFWNLGRLLITVLWATLPPASHWQYFFYASTIFPFIFSVYLILC